MNVAEIYTASDGEQTIIRQLAARLGAT